MSVYGGGVYANVRPERAGMRLEPAGIRTFQALEPIQQSVIVTTDLRPSARELPVENLPMSTSLHAQSNAPVPGAAPFMQRWQSTAFALVTSAAAVASSRGLASILVAVAMVAAGALLDRRRRARDAHARQANAAFLASADQLGRDVLPVWAAHIENSRQQMESAVAALTQ